MDSPVTRAECNEHNRRMEDNIQSQIDNLKKFVADDKKLLASAISLESGKTLTSDDVSVENIKRY